MTDRELLEYAAKAAGVEVLTDYRYSSDKGIWCGFGDSPYAWWNPLADDGDALRLAMKLGIPVGVFANYASIANDSDHFAATRRAIVRAAAEIGRGRQ